MVKMAIKKKCKDPPRSSPQCSVNWIFLQSCNWSRHPPGPVWMPCTILTLSDGSFLEHGWLPLKHVLISTHADGKLRSAEDAQNPLCVVPSSPILYPMNTCCLLLPGLPASCPQLRESSELYLNGLVCNLAQGYKLRQLQNFLGLFPISQDSCHSLHDICCIRKPLFHILSFSFFPSCFLKKGEGLPWWSSG